jgi:hypothetical protein
MALPSAFLRFAAAQGKAVEGLKVQGQKPSGSEVCEHSLRVMDSDSDFQAFDLQTEAAA